MTTRVAVIMAGGSGERFWPLSRQERPKQLLRLTSETETLLEEAVNRINPLIPAERIFIATSRVLGEPIRAAKLVSPENVLAEPARRNTAGCLCWVAAQLMARFPGEEVTIAVLTADHLIGNPDLFRGTVKVALEAAESEDALVTIGVRPTRVETGYGYIEAQTQAPCCTRAYSVKRFREKPDRKTAEEFLEAGNFFWNSGMFFWKLETFLKELSSASPDHERSTRKVKVALCANDEEGACAAFEELPNISIDYALMERAKRVLMVEADFPWDDVGAWDSLARSRKADTGNNVIDGECILVDTHDSIIINDTGKKIAVGVAGVNGLVIVVAEDAVLVVPKDRVQDVKKIVQELKERDATQL